MPIVTYVGNQTYGGQAQTYPPAHIAGDMLLACVVTGAGVQPSLTSTGGSSAPWKTIVRASRTGAYGDRYMTIAYKIASSAVPAWTETISTGGTGGTGLASSVIVARGGKGIGGSGSNITGTSSTNMYAWNGPAVTMKKTDGTSLLVYFCTGYSQWGVSSVPTTGNNIFGGSQFGAGYQNTASGAGVGWAQSGGAPFEFALNAMVEITDTGASSGFFNMF